MTRMQIENSECTFHLCRGLSFGCAKVVGPLCCVCDSFHFESSRVASFEAQASSSFMSSFTVSRLDRNNTLNMHGQAYPFVNAQLALC